jgi:hypothetical protein
VSLDLNIESDFAVTGGLDGSVIIYDVKNGKILCEK